MNTAIGSRLVLRRPTDSGPLGVAGTPLFAFCLSGWV